MTYKAEINIDYDPENAFWLRSGKGKVSSDLAKNIGDSLEVDWNKIDLEQFRQGLEVELEHKDVTFGDMEKTGKIALAHLKEVPDYYSKLKIIEKEAAKIDYQPKEEKSKNVQITALLSEWIEKQQKKRAYHDHEGTEKPHPVAVKDHQKYFSEHVGEVKTEEMVEKPQIEEKPQQEKIQSVSSAADAENGSENILNDVLSLEPTKDRNEKRRLQKELVKKYGDNSTFKILATAAALYTQGFFSDIRDISAALNTNTLEQFFWNRSGYFGADARKGDGNPLMTISGLGRVRDVFGNDTDQDEAPEYLRRMRYKDVLEYARLLNKSISNAPKKKQALYRGLERAPAGTKDLKPGDIFYIPGVTSFTLSSEVADRFVAGVGDKGGVAKFNQFGYKIQVVGDTQSIGVDVFSPYQQAEVLTNGIFEVVDAGPRFLNLRQIKVADEDFPKNAGVKYAFPTEIAKLFSSEEFDKATELKYFADTSFSGSVHLPDKWKENLDDFGKPDNIDWTKVLKVFESLGYQIEALDEYVRISRPKIEAK